MRAFAIVAAAALVPCLAGQSVAADLGGWYGGRSQFGSAYDDGPYYITPRENDFYIDCGKPRIPYPDDAFGPEPNTRFFGPVGYRCIRGTYNYEPFYPPRCVTTFIKTPHGWRRQRHCY